MQKKDYLALLTHHNPELFRDQTPARVDATIEALKRFRRYIKREYPSATRSHDDWIKLAAKLHAQGTIDLESASCAAVIEAVNNNWPKKVRDVGSTFDGPKINREDRDEGNWPGR